MNREIRFVTPPEVLRIWAIITPNDASLEERLVKLTAAARMHEAERSTLRAPIRRTPPQTSGKPPR